MGYFPTEVLDIPFTAFQCQKLICESVLWSRFKSLITAVIPFYANRKKLVLYGVGYVPPLKRTLRKNLLKFAELRNKCWYIGRFKNPECMKPIKEFFCYLVLFQEALSAAPLSMRKTFLQADLFDKWNCVEAVSGIRLWMWSFAEILRLGYLLSYGLIYVYCALKFPRKDLDISLNLYLRSWLFENVSCASPCITNFSYF